MAETKSAAQLSDFGLVVDLEDEPSRKKSRDGIESIRTDSQTQDSHQPRPASLQIGLTFNTRWACSSQTREHDDDECVWLYPTHVWQALGLNDAKGCVFSQRVLPDDGIIANVAYEDICELSLRNSAWDTADQSSSSSGISPISSSVSSQGTCVVEDQRACAALPVKGVRPMPLQPGRSSSGSKVGSVTMLDRILCSCDDAQARAVLIRCLVTTVKKTGKLIIVDSMADPPGVHRVDDASTGSMRTHSDWKLLLASCAFRITSVTRLRRNEVLMEVRSVPLVNCNHVKRPGLKKLS
jgi:hypothetical protein